MEYANALNLFLRLKDATASPSNIGMAFLAVDNCQFVLFTCAWLCSRKAMHISLHVLTELLVQRKGVRSVYMESNQHTIVKCMQGQDSIAYIQQVRLTSKAGEDEELVEATAAVGAGDDERVVGAGGDWQHKRREARGAVTSTRRCSDEVLAAGADGLSALHISIRLQEGKRSKRGRTA